MNSLDGSSDSVAKVVRLTTEESADGEAVVRVVNLNGQDAPKIKVIRFGRDEKSRYVAICEKFQVQMAWRYAILQIGRSEICERGE